MFKNNVLKKNVKKKQIASRFVKVLKKTLKKNDLGGAAKQKPMDLDCCGAARRRRIFLVPFCVLTRFPFHFQACLPFRNTIF